MPRGTTAEKTEQMEQRRSSILSLLKNDGPQHSPALLAATKLTKGELTRVLNFLKDGGHIVQEGIKRHAFYRLPSQEGQRPQAFTKPNGTEKRKPRRKRTVDDVAFARAQPKHTAIVVPSSDPGRKLRELVATKRAELAGLEQALALLEAS